MHLRITLSSALAVLAAVLGCEGCENGSPPAGEACAASGGICSTTECGASLPYPCPGKQSCCEPPPSSHGDAGTD
jgi:hypothetical protein